LHLLSTYRACPFLPVGEQTVAAARMQARTQLPFGPLISKAQDPNCVVFATLPVSFSAATVARDFPVSMSPIYYSKSGVSSCTSLMIDCQWIKTGHER